MSFEKHLQHATQTACKITQLWDLKLHCIDRQRMPEWTQDYFVSQTKGPGDNLKQNEQRRDRRRRRGLHLCDEVTAEIQTPSIKDKSGGWLDISVEEELWIIRLHQTNEGARYRKYVSFVCYFWERGLAQSLGYSLFCERQRLASMKTILTFLHLNINLSV